ncbi:hypothetical protein OF83DRAFT_1174280 [Amylostereum chailletii]|nr:hypothetical protein OF83DRAFT_1174280 [Amylostereum chailletii]
MPLLSLLFVLIAFIFELVSAQNFNIPSNWLIQSTASQSYSDRAVLAQDAIGDLLRLVNLSSGTIDSFPRPFQSADLMAVVALNDWVAGNTTYQSTVVNNVNAYTTVNPNYLQQVCPMLPSRAYNSDTLSWGLTAYYAYRAYGSKSFLDIASDAWAQADKYFITEAQAASGSHPARPNVTLQSTCDESTTAGGLFFHSASETNGEVNAETVGRFLILSAYLYNATTQTQYRTAADLSGTFLRNHLYNNTVILDTIYIASCQKSQASYVFSYNSGFAIQGFAVWASVLKNDSWANLAENLVSTSVPFNAWTRPSDGVISEGKSCECTHRHRMQRRRIKVSYSYMAQSESGGADEDAYQNGYKGLFIRGLHEAWWVSDPTSDMAKFIEQFITVQFSALQNKAYFPPSNAYDASWIGPASSVFHAYPEVTALQVLNSAINLAQRSNTSVGSSTSPTSSSPSPSATVPSNDSASSKSASHTGAIIGGAVGGVLGLLALLTLGLLLARRQRRKAHRGLYSSTNSLAAQSPIQPFVSEPYNPASNRLPPTLLPNGKLSRQREHSMLVMNPSSDGLSQPSESSRAAATTEVSAIAYGGAIEPLVRELMVEITGRLRAQQQPEEEVSPPRYSQ